MNDFRNAASSGTPPKRESALKDERLQQLMDSCQQEVLRQIIGPFGLTPAMFDDKDGGNVATVHNADKSIFPDEAHSNNYELAGQPYSQELRQKHLDDKKSRAEAYKKINEDLDAGKKVHSEATARPMTKGQINGDHTKSLKEAHEDKAFNLRFSEEERKKILNNEKNMAFIEESLNKSKKDRSWSECLADPEFVKKHQLTPEDIDRIKQKDKQARRYIQEEKNKRLTGEVVSSGAKEAGKNALRQALGVVLHEFVNGSFVEIKMQLQARHDEKSLVDRIVESLKRVMNRVINKFKTALQAAIQGGVQGFISNLLTFLINTLITTSRKVVAIIRESMKSLWRAITLLVNPPADMSALEITREVTKIIAVVVTTGLGMVLEESVKGFIMGLPFLAPVADALATGLTAIMTGIAGALIVYGIDRMFDWLSSTGSELLAAQEAQLDAQVAVVGRLETWLAQQFETSRLYDDCAAGYRQLQQSFTATSFQMETAVLAAQASVKSKSNAAAVIQTHKERSKKLASLLNSL